MDPNQEEKPDAGSNVAFNDVRYYSGPVKYLTWNSTIRGIMKSFVYATIIAIMAWKFSSHLSYVNEEVDEFDRVFDEIEKKNEEMINQFVVIEYLKREIEKTVNQTILDSLKDPNVPVEQNDDDSTRSPKKIGGIYVSYLELRTDSMHRLKNKMTTENKKADLSFFNEITKFGYSEHNFKEGKDCEIEGKQLECIPYKCSCKNGSAVQQEQCLKSGESCADCDVLFSLAESTLSSSLKEKNQKAKPKTCKKNKCKCENENGETVGDPADDCTKKELKGNKCKRCYNGYTMYTIPNSARKTCKANFCTCLNGTPKTGKNCHSYDDQEDLEKEQCVSCNEGYDKDASGDKCVANICWCQLTEWEYLIKGKRVINKHDKKWKSEKGTDKGNEEKICKRKDSDQCLESHCQEFGDTWMFNSTTSKCDPSCKHENGVCKKCQAGYYRTGEERVCRPCDFGYHPFSDMCIKNICTCDNGTPNSIDNYTQDQCKVDGEESCFICDPGYTIDFLTKKCVKAKPDEPPTYFRTGAPLPTKKLKECQDRGDCKEPGALYCDHKDGNKLIKAVKPDNTIDSDCKPVTCKCFVGVPQTGPHTCRYPKYDSTEVMFEKCDEDSCDYPSYGLKSNYVSDYYVFEDVICQGGGMKWQVSRLILNLNQEDLKKGKRTYEFSQTNPDYVCDNWTEWDDYSEENFSHFDLRENFCRNPDGALQSDTYLWCLKIGTQTKIKCETLVTIILLDSYYYDSKAYYYDDDY